MRKLDEFASLGWRHPIWEILKVYRGLSRGTRKRREWLSQLETHHLCSFPGDEASPIQVDEEISKLLGSYIEASAEQAEEAFGRFRTEREALAHCESIGVTVATTRTQSADHHQSPKALVGGVTLIAADFCCGNGISIDPNPQNRCVWTHDSSMHVTSRRLDGAIPGLVNPRIIWEIKEYWGKTSGGSKMSDAVYECQLVGRELRNWEEGTGLEVCHVVFLDGLEQWKSRRSDFVRFSDLANQGLIDQLIIGGEVEEDWAKLLAAELGSISSADTQ